MSTAQKLATREDLFARDDERLEVILSAVVLTATRGETVHAEPFEPVPFPVGILFGDDA